MVRFEDQRKPQKVNGTINQPVLEGDNRVYACSLCNLCTPDVCPRLSTSSTVAILRESSMILQHPCHQGSCQKNCTDPQPSLRTTEPQQSLKHDVQVLSVKSKDPCALKTVISNDLMQNSLGSWFGKFIPALIQTQRIRSLEMKLGCLNNKPDPGLHQSMGPTSVV